MTSPLCAVAPSSVALQNLKLTSKYVQTFILLRSKIMGDRTSLEGDGTWGDCVRSWATPPVTRLDRPLTGI